MNDETYIDPLNSEECECCHDRIPKDDYGVTTLILTFTGQLVCPKCNG